MEYVVNNFSGGMNRALSPLLVQPPELVTVTNMLPEPRGTVERRGGAKVVLPSIGTSENIEGLGKFYRQPSDATDIFMAASDAAVYDLDDGSSLFAIDAGAEVTFTQLATRCCHRLRRNSTTICVTVTNSISKLGKPRKPGPSSRVAIPGIRLSRQPFNSLPKTAQTATARSNQPSPHGGRSIGTVIANHCLTAILTGATH